MTVSTAGKSKVGRPRSPRDEANRTELVRIASLASNVLISLHRPGRGMYESERELRKFLDEDGVQFTSSDIAPALALLEASSKIGRSASKPNVARTGWLVVNGNWAVEPAESVAEPVATPDTPEASEDVTGLPDLTGEQRIDALAAAIIRAFKSGRGYQGNRTLCESETTLREWLKADGVEFDESDLPAALTKLETATLPGFERSRLLRGSTLHRSYPITAKPLPSRAMQLKALHPMDAMTYESADIEPYVI